MFFGDLQSVPPRCFFVMAWARDGFCKETKVTSILTAFHVVRGLRHSLRLWQVMKCNNRVTGEIHGPACVHQQRVQQAGLHFGKG